MWDPVSCPSRPSGERGLLSGQHKSSLALELALEPALEQALAQALAPALVLTLAHALELTLALYKH